MIIFFLLTNNKSNSEFYLNNKEIIDIYNICTNKRPELRYSISELIKQFCIFISQFVFCPTPVNSDPSEDKNIENPPWMDLISKDSLSISNINEYFIDMQNASVKASAKLQDKKMYQAVYGNLKLMKRALNPDQYRKYVTLLNITNNNNRTMGVNTFPEVYLADNASK